jgi:hypothetical protein
MTDGNWNSDTHPISPNEDAFAELAGSVPQLPSSGQRWTVRRKAAVVEAVRGGWVPIEDVAELYELSADEIVAWERDIDRYGIPGLRSTRVQVYRDTAKVKSEGSPAAALRTRYMRKRGFRLPR